MCEDGVDCTFLRDVDGLQHRLNALWDSPEQPDTARLLADFFLFYGSEFDFGRQAVCVVEGEARTKRRARPAQRHLFHLDMTNPLEPDLNVAGNVQLHAIEKFQVGITY